MKKRLLLIPVLVGSTMAFSQKLSFTKVLLSVKESFQKAHPGAKASWELEESNYEANFKEKGKVMSCVFDKGGAILETESAIALNELPADAKTYVLQHRKGKKINEVAKIEKAGGETSYEVNVQGKDILFDTNGKRINKPGGK